MYHVIHNIIWAPFVVNYYMSLHDNGSMLILSFYKLKTSKEVFLGVLANLKYQITQLYLSAKNCFVLFKTV